ncbi:S-layer homology domain-containing protein [Cohnella mopanensis]|uniref:S-layer homology domain-containing protein n=1 Tax=Cohnella mopanensis TaxID=2911966 RepID=UPI001EF9AEE4|nr:S-layer homology domain-containing protein [Cohnella mopanensis]
MKINKKIVSMALVAAVGATVAGQAFAAEADTTNAAMAVNGEAAMNELVRQGVLNGYGTQGLKPEQQASRAELAKIAQLAFKLELGSATAKTFSDVPNGAWHSQYINVISGLGIMNGTSATTFKPAAPVTQAQLALVVSRITQIDMATVTSWLSQYSPLAVITRAEIAQVVTSAQEALANAPVKVMRVKSLSKMTVEIVLSKPIAEEEANLDLAQKNLTFNNGLQIVNVPRLKSGSISTYIVPVTTQKAATTYTFSYKGKMAGSFASSQENIRMDSTRSVTSDTFEVESLRTDGVVDYGYVIQAYAGGRGSLAFALDEDNQYNGQAFQIISSLRDRVATITPQGGEPIVAAYVPFTQSTDGRQGAKFRLPAGQSLKVGTSYTVTADWFTLKNQTFVAQQAAPLVIESAKQTSATSLEITLAADPKDELFAGRGVTLTADDGTVLTAQYKFQSRKGAVGVFDLLNDGQLQVGKKYAVTPIGDWATVASPVNLGQ